MPLYGNQLWDLDSTAINRFYVAWRKAVRYLLHLPRTTHCALLHLICDGMPILHQLCFRFITFFRSLIYSNNNITRYCARMALYGSISSVSYSLTHVSRVLKCDRYDVTEIDHVYIVNNNQEENYIIASVIRDLLTIKYDNMYIPEHKR